VASFFTLKSDSGGPAAAGSFTYQFSYAPLLAPARRLILIATKAMLVIGHDTGSIFDGALVEG
jgi:hypothetical protein